MYTECLYIMYVIAYILGKMGIKLFIMSNPLKQTQIEGRIIYQSSRKECGHTMLRKVYCWVVLAEFFTVFMFV